MTDDLVNLLAAFLSGSGLVSLINLLANARHSRSQRRLESMSQAYLELLAGARRLYDQVIDLDGIPAFTPPDEGDL